MTLKELRHGVIKLLAEYTKSNEFTASNRQVRDWVSSLVSSLTVALDNELVREFHELLHEESSDLGDFTFKGENPETATKVVNIKEGLKNRVSKGNAEVRPAGGSPGGGSGTGEVDGVRPEGINPADGSPAGAGKDGGDN